MSCPWRQVPLRGHRLGGRVLHAEPRAAARLCGAAPRPPRLTPSARGTAAAAGDPCRGRRPRLVACRAGNRVGLTRPGPGERRGQDAAGPAPGCDPGMAGRMPAAGCCCAAPCSALPARGPGSAEESPVGRVPMAHNAGGCGAVGRHGIGEGDVSAGAEPNVYALLTDGSTVEIRPARPEDFDAVREMHEKLTPDSLYLRFFSMSPSAAGREARRLCREPAPDHVALLAVMDGELVGCGSYECDAPRSRSAEIAFTVADGMHNRGVGMLLMEHLISLARGRGLRAFTAETLSENAAMLRVFADAGLQAHRALADGVYDLTFPLPAGEEDVALGTYRDAVAERERSANVASLRHALAPASVAVIGASRRRRLGRAGHPAQHRQRRLPRPRLRGQPGRGRTGRRSLRPVGGRAARRCRPGGHRRAGRGGDRYRRGMRAAWDQGAGGARGGTRRRGPRGAAGHLPAPRHADGRAGQLRGGRHQAAWTPRSRPATPSREARAWRCSRPAAPARLGRAPVADRRRDLLPRLARRQR